MKKFILKDIKKFFLSFLPFCLFLIALSGKIPECHSQTAVNTTSNNKYHQENGTNGKTHQNKKKINLTGRLPPRKTSASASLMLGFASPTGFLLGADIAIGWRLIKLASLNLKIGAGGVQKRGGGTNTYLHGDILFPIRMAICSHSPRICPGLDFYISVVPGIGYAMLIRNKTVESPAEIINHEINAILGLTLESIRTYGNMDAGVRFGIYTYIDCMKENENENWVPSLLFEFGAVIRWG